MNLKQLKLANGEEVICDVVEEYDEELLVKQALRLFKIELNAYTSYYTFRPWMIMKEDLDDIVLINPYHIVGACVPSSDLVLQYEHAIENIMSDEDDDQQDVKERLKAMMEEDEIDPYGDLDSSSNVISLFSFDKDKLH